MEKKVAENVACDTVRIGDLDVDEPGNAAGGFGSSLAGVRSLIRIISRALFTRFFPRIWILRNVERPFGDLDRMSSRRQALLRMRREEVRQTWLFLTDV